MATTIGSFAGARRMRIWFGRKGRSEAPISPLSPWGRGVGGEGWGRFPRGTLCLTAVPSPHPPPLSPKGRGEKEFCHPRSPRLRRCEHRREAHSHVIAILPLSAGYHPV